MGEYDGCWLVQLFVWFFWSGCKKSGYVSWAFQTGFSLERYHLLVSDVKDTLPHDRSRFPAGMVRRRSYFDILNRSIITRIHRAQGYISHSHRTFLINNLYSPRCQMKMKEMPNFLYNSRGWHVDVALITAHVNVQQITLDPSTRTETTHRSIRPAIYTVHLSSLLASNHSIKLVRCVIRDKIYIYYTYPKDKIQEVFMKSRIRTILFYSEYSDK